MVVAADNVDMSAPSALPLVHLNNTNSGSSTNELLYIIDDHLRAPVKLTTTAKAIVWDRFQTPFGETATQTGTKQTNIRMPGQYFDFESEYHYNLMRDYDAKTGRYMQSDPIGLAGGINRFGYVSGNPVNRVDSKGTSALFAGILGAAELCIANPACSGAVGGMIYMMGQNNSKSNQSASNSTCKNGDSGDSDNCEELLDIDTNTCKGITRMRGKIAGTKCHQSAMERYSACLVGRPLPPLNTWNN